VIVDLGLPDGSGLDLIVELASARVRPAVLLATSGCQVTEGAIAARRAGADGFLPKPLADIASFQSSLLVHLPDATRPRPLRTVTGEMVAPDRLALSEDYAFADRALSDERVSTGYVAAFLQSVARADRDEALMAETALLSRAGSIDARPQLRALVRERLGPRRLP
jgi:DNA-binding response OmpR family regulator